MGPATRITAPRDVARYQGLLPWIDRDMDHMLGISAERGTGYGLER